MTPGIVRWILPAAVLAAGVAQVGCVVPGETRMGFTVGVEGAPPPPPVVVAEPAMVQVETGAWVVTDPSIRYDMFRYGPAWYVYSGGFWYRGPSVRGPFAVVDVRTVPRPVLGVPPGHWKHHPRGPPEGGPPGRGRGRWGRED